MLSNELFKFCITNGAVKKKKSNQKKPQNAEDPERLEIRRLLRRL